MEREASMVWGLKVGVARAGMEERVMRARRRGRGMVGGCHGAHAGEKETGQPAFP